jgi:hypothetical protein
MPAEGSADLLAGLRQGQDHERGYTISCCGPLCPRRDQLMRVRRGPNVLRC